MVGNVVFTFITCDGYAFNQTLENKPTFLLSSHLLSSPIDIFLGDYGISY